MDWMLYGAYGFTGKLIAAEAVKRGHRPILAGRSAEKLAHLANKLGLPSVQVSLDDIRALEKAISQVGLVMHSAGPFIHTSEPMLQACLAAGAHYLDITGEIPVLENTFSQDPYAREKGLALISGCGFDVIPTDCLAKYVADQVPGADTLEIAITGVSGYSSGTALTALEMLPNGGQVRRDGMLRHLTLGQGSRRVRFMDHERTVIPIPWGDLATAYCSTGIPNITTYSAFPRRLRRLLGFSGQTLETLFKLPMARRIAAGFVSNFIHGPEEKLNKTGKAYAWACARNPEGKIAEAWLQTEGAYHFTALSAVRCVEKTLQLHPVGAVTPVQAFGVDFVLEIPGTVRKSEL